MRGWMLAAGTAALVGITAGIGSYTFVYAKGASYLTTDPAACANCHVMREHYDAWLKSSHRAAATCSDCHMPHSFAGKYLEKAKNGFLHSLAFTTGRYPDPLQIRESNRAVTEKQCRDCHGEITSAIGSPTDRPASPARPGSGGRTQIHDGTVPGPDITCIRCHTHVGHDVR